MPAAIDTMSCSAMPHSTKRSGKRFANDDQPAVLDQIGVEREQTRMALGLRRPARARRRRPGCRSAAAHAAGCACASRCWTGPRPSSAKSASADAQQLREPGRVLCFARRTRVIPVELARLHRRAFHEADALALHRVGDDHLRPVRDGVERAERALERGDVVAVARGSRASRTRGTSPRDRRDG